MLYDPDDPNQALYKSNMQPPLPFIRVEVTAMVRGKPVHQTISDPKGISYKEYQAIDKAAVVAFGNDGTKTEGTWPGDFGSTVMRQYI